jgi:hypothetical protein
MINSIVAIPLLVGTLYLLFFVYRRVRIDLFRDKVFQIRRSLFLIAADNPEEFFKSNSPYRYFENILNSALSYTEEFSLVLSILDTTIRYDYAKRKDIASFDYDHVKKAYLKKINSPEARKEVAKLLDDFQFHYGLFLLTRTFLGTVLFSSVIIFVALFIVAKAFYDKNKELEELEKTTLFYSSINYFQADKLMSNSRFAFVASMF